MPRGGRDTVVKTEMSSGTSYLHRMPRSGAAGTSLATALPARHAPPGTATLAPPSGSGRQKRAVGSGLKQQAAKAGARKKSKTSTSTQGGIVKSKTKRYTGQPDKSPKLCQHNRKKSKCKDCGGGSLCEVRTVAAATSANTRG